MKIKCTKTSWIIPNFRGGSLIFLKSTVGDREAKRVEMVWYVMSWWAGILLVIPAMYYI